MRKKAFRKLKRLELVELIYQLRKDNLDLRKRCRELEKQLRKAEKIALAGGSQVSEERLERIEQMLADIRRANQLEQILDQAQSEMLAKAEDPDLFGEETVEAETQAEEAETEPEEAEAQAEEAETEPEEAEPEEAEAEDDEAEEPDEIIQE